jgi:hypothetical protein
MDNATLWARRLSPARSCWSVSQCGIVLAGSTDSLIFRDDASPLRFLGSPRSTRRFSGTAVQRIFAPLLRNLVIGAALKQM